MQQHEIATNARENALHIYFFLIYANVLFRILGYKEKKKMMLRAAKSATCSGTRGCRIWDRDAVSVLSVLV